MRTALTRTLTRILTRAGGVALLLGAFAPTLRAQNLGPFRQFLAVEPYYAYEHLDLDDGSSGSDGLHGFGARLWLNTAPFGVSDKLGVGLFTTYIPDQNDRGASLMHYGAQLEFFPVHRPLGGLIDPFVTAGVGGFRMHAVSDDAGDDATVTHLALTPGAGIRIPIPNRFQIRVDVRDAIVSGFAGADGSSRRSNNIEATAALGLTF